MSLDPDEVDALLEEPQSIYAPDGTTFAVRAVMNHVAHSIDDLFDYGPAYFQVRGPGDNNHVWVAAANGQFIPNPRDDDVPAIWTIKAHLALQGWLALRESPAT